MYSRSSELEEHKDFTADQVRAMYLKKYNNLPTSGRCSNKDPMDAPILSLVWVAQNLVDDSNKSYDKSNTPNIESTKGEPYYTRDLPPWILEYPKGGMGNKTKDGKEYWMCKEHCAGKFQWVHHKTEDCRKRTGTSSSSRGSTDPPSKRDSNKIMNLTKDFKDGIMDIKDKRDVQYFLYQFNINDQENE